jgi:hypothetical protein
MVAMQDGSTMLSFRGAVNSLIKRAGIRKYKMHMMMQTRDHAKE